MCALRFAANVSWLFLEEATLARRLLAARNAGFDAVEAAWPYEHPVNHVEQARKEAGVRVALLNSPPGKGGLGLGAQPGRQVEFRTGLEMAVSYANALGCDRINVLAGRIPSKGSRVTMTSQMEETYVENLRFSADLLEKNGIIGLVEPINNRLTEPLYFVNTPHQALDIVQKVNRPNIKLQLDLFHCQIMDGNLTGNIQSLFPYIGHIQIAQVPRRSEPDSAGEINFPYIFSLLEELGYQGYVGCEYAPRGDTLSGLQWLRNYWKEHNVKQTVV
uniref:Putative hydroxypyruvate isomerase n=1 Tax=Eptatretus burgeri TaxID=7764 RepID=A0A8C4N1F2_EPTBU